MIFQPDSSSLGTWRARAQLGTGQRQEVWSGSRRERGTGRVQGENGDMARALERVRGLSLLWKPVKGLRWVAGVNTQASKLVEALAAWLHGREGDYSSGHEAAAQGSL